MKKKIDYKICKVRAGHPKFAIRWPDEIPDKVTFMENEPYKERNESSDIIFDEFIPMQKARIK